MRLPLNHLLKEEPMETTEITRLFASHVRRLFVKPSNSQPELRLVHGAVGVSGEAGELLDAIKKHWIYNAELDTENVKEEIGDLLFYAQAILNELGFTMEECMRHNIEKLRARYPDGYTDIHARARLDKADE